MTRHVSALVVVVVACGVVLAWQARRYGIADSRVRSAERTLDAVVDDARELERLRLIAARSSFGPPPEQDLIRRASDNLRAAGLPGSSMRSLATDGDRAVGGRDGQAGLRRRDARLVLEPVTVEDLGRFLGHWRTEHTLWTVSEVELSRNAQRGSQQGYSCRLVLSTLYIDPSAERP